MESSAGTIFPKTEKRSQTNQSYTTDKEPLAPVNSESLFTKKAIIDKQRLGWHIQAIAPIPRAMQFLLGSLYRC